MTDAGGAWDEQLPSRKGPMQVGNKMGTDQCTVTCQLDITSSTAAARMAFFFWLSAAQSDFSHMQGRLQLATARLSPTAASLASPVDRCAFNQISAS